VVSRPSFIVLSPKSVSLTVTSSFFAAKRMFSGFTSRWVMLKSCK